MSDRFLDADGDGQFGGLTTSDLKSAQVWAGLEPDGNAGPETKRRITI